MRLSITPILISVCMGLFSNQIMAQSNEGLCSVIGYHEPGTTVYHGPTFCSNTVLSSLTVHGPLQLDRTEIKGKTDVSGPIKAKSANLQKIILENNMTRVMVSLESASIVNDDITFLGKEGVVYLEAGSVVKGKVINGKIINKLNDDETNPQQ